ncbi:NAD(P)-binding domain-containing protein [Actinomycetes bacterium KLBMP 9759]
MTSTAPPPVTVVGLGPMGQAMVRTFLDHGHPTTVWNRTTSRAADVVARGAVLAPTPAEAVAASELVVLSLTDFQAMYDILGDVHDELKGRVVVNLSSDTPDRSREAARWLAERGAELLVGGIMVPAVMVGTEASSVFYSGPRAVFDAHQPTLRRIGHTDYRGPDHGLAQLYYQALLDLFLTAHVAFLHAAALVGTAGESATTFVPYAVQNLELLGQLIPAEAAAIDADDHPGDQGTVAMMGATAEHILTASRNAGLADALPAAVHEIYRRAIAAGLGTSAASSMIDVIRTP